ncbi:MAG: hypothetical protein V4576_03830 [Patescibacteria group bacterium]
MSKNIQITSSKKADRTDIVTGTATFSMSKGELWKYADHPHKLTPHCINLSGFVTDDTIQVGSHIEETHSFIGWRQRYVGAIKSVIKDEEWSMYTAPIGFGPFPLPHFVKYSFRDLSEGQSRLTISCEYKAGGLLSLPGVRTIVRNIMARAIGKLLLVPGIGQNNQS